MFANKDIAPDWDMVSVINFLIRGLGDTAPNLLSTDLFDFTINEHQPYLPMLIWGIDFKVFNSFGLLPQILMQLFAILSVVLITGRSRFGSSPQSMMAIAITLCGCALILSPMHWENLVWPNQVHLYVSVLFSVIALSVAVSIPKRKWKHQILQVLLSSLFSVCATFSFGWGLAVWPALLIHGLLSRWNWRAYLTLVLAGACTIAFYFSRFSVIAGHGDPLESLFDPIAIVNYAALLLASPLVFVGIGNALTYIVGYLFLAVFTFSCYRAYIQRQVLDDRQLRSLLVCLFCVGVGLMTGLGRSGLASRYMLIPTLFIIALPGLFPLFTPILSNGKKLVLLAYLLGILGLASASFLFDDGLRSRQFMIKDGAIAAAFGTKPIHRGLSPVLEKINNHVWPFYIKHHGHSPPVNILTWISKPLPDAYKTDPSTGTAPQCIGFVDSFDSREGDPEFDIIQGWVRLGPKGEREAQWVVITNASGVVVGLGATGTDRPDVAKHLEANWFDNLLTRTNRAGFSGLVRSRPGEALNFFAYKDGECHLFANNVKAPDAEIIAP
ncbi:MAG: hypothetical protein O3C43_23790 [Verrucomicrobia bacterium]|nr:hypothetical protein [Verrucomicrobiota bacterium]MDA1069508.1 hypothetical protein [Verrucomicrobiota bacterium]